MASPDEPTMSFWSHMDELRKRLVAMCIAIGIGFVVCFSLSEKILGLLLLPLNGTLGLSAAFPYFVFTPNETAYTLHFTSLTEPFMAHLKIGIIAGIMVTIPILLRQVWIFISPGLLPRERRYAGQFVFFSTVFFAFGVVFCFLVLLPVAIPFLVTYKTEHLTPIIKIGDYIDFTLKFMLATGAVFELPLIMILLGRMGIITSDGLSKFRKYAFLTAFVIGGILTPTPDAFNMTIMSIPIYLLYELGILGVRLLGKKKPEPDSTSLSEI